MIADQEHKAKREESIFAYLRKAIPVTPLPTTSKPLATTHIKCDDSYGMNFPILMSPLLGLGETDSQSLV